MWIVLLSCVVGVCAGTVTGLIPGIHINLVSTLLVGMASVLTWYVSPFVLCCFIIAMSVTHTFLDVIPSVYLGAPDSDTCLGVLPGHRFLLDGEGYTAVQLTVVGSLGALVLSAVLFPLFLWLARAYPFIQDYLAVVLGCIVVFMIVREEQPIWAGIVFLLSGVLGYAVLNHPGLNRPLFPLLTGLFGVSTLGYSLRSPSALPVQRCSSDVGLNSVDGGIAVGLGQVSGFLTAMLPGVGASTAAVLAVSVYDLDEYGFMVLIGAVNTVNFVLSLAALLAVGTARNGSIIAVQQLVSSVSMWMVVGFLSVACVAGGVATGLTLFVARRAAKILRVVDYQLVVVCVLTLLVVLSLVLSGVYGFVIMVVATMVGLLPVLVGVKRTHAMGCLLLPVTIFFL